MTGDQANFLQSLGWAVLNSLWQMAALWVLYQLVTTLFRNLSPAIKSRLASTLLMSGFAWFVLTFLTAFSYSHTPAGNPVIHSVLAGAGGDIPPNHWLPTVLPWASGVYLLLLLIPLTRFARNIRYVGIIRKHGLTKMQVDWRLFVKRVAGQMGIRQHVKIWVSEFVSSPVTIGFLKPVILVPLAVINQLTPQQLEAVLLHELAHIRRNDYLVNLVISFIRTILYFNPFVKAFVSIVEREREKSCDEMVLQFQYDSYEYATALLALEKNSRVQHPLALAAGGKRNDLLHRVENIMGVKRKTVFSMKRMSGWIAGLCCIIALNALLLITKNNKQTPSSSYTYLSSPFVSLTGLEAETPLPGQAIPLPAAEPGKELAATPVINHIREKSDTIQSLAIAAPSETEITETENPYKYISYREAAEAELKAYQEEQVQRTMEASRKVLESTQWKMLEKSIADAFTEQEKELLKNSYHQQVSRFDWKKWENNLRRAYTRVDWEKVNLQLDNAIREITIDSLHKVYSDIVITLSDAKKEVAQLGVRGIPDTDITLKEVEKARQEAQKSLNTIRVLRAKKTVHL